jgi:cytochrome b
MIEASSRIPVKLWDLPVRLVHWSFVLLLPMLWWTGENGELELHRLAGYIMLALVLFRMIWGVMGGATARFSNFLRGPATILRFMRGNRDAPSVGHNPIGALSVIGMLALLFAQVAFGLFAQDVDGIESGPLTYLVEYDTADWARGMHHLLFNVLLGLVGLHVLAILYYRLVKGTDLVTPMITGNRTFDVAVEPPATAPLRNALISAALAGGISYWVALGAPLPVGG